MLGGREEVSQRVGSERTCGGAANCDRGTAARMDLFFGVMCGVQSEVLHPPSCDVMSSVAVGDGSGSGAAWDDHGLDGGYRAKHEKGWHGWDRKDMDGRGWEASYTVCSWRCLRLHLRLCLRLPVRAEWDGMG
jgi:hypothetical protein